MSRQQKRATQRVIGKQVAQKKPAAAKKTFGSNVVAGGPIVVRYEDLSERQERGVALWQRAQNQNGMMLLVNANVTLWFSQNDNTRAYQVERSLRNQRGKMVIGYSCKCDDFLKHGRIDCKHIFAERLRRGEVVVAAAPAKKASNQKKATRRPARKRFAHDGRTIRSSQRSARRKMPERIPDLAVSLKRAFDLNPRGLIIRMNPQGGKKPAPASSRALALLAKVACGFSASEMMPEYERMLEDGTLLLRRAPNEDTLSDWYNDGDLTAVLREFLRLSAYPFHRREIAAIVDSSKMSQLMTAHYKEVEYNNRDKRPTADWMKCHALVGVETLVVMAVEFSGSRGDNTHDTNFLKPLVDAALGTFPLELLLGDKAYLTEEIPEWLASRSTPIRAGIPIKKGWFRSEKRTYNQALVDLIEWYDRNNNRDFHELYRLRPKVECLFSILKRVADGYCWTRGRKRTAKNADEPCVAWINETLAKLTYVNLRTTVSLEEETGVKIDYLVPSRAFPVPAQPLVPRRVNIA